MKDPPFIVQPPHHHHPLAKMHSSGKFCLRSCIILVVISFLVALLLLKIPFSQERSRAETAIWWEDALLHGSTGKGDNSSYSQEASMSVDDSSLADPGVGSVQGTASGMQGMLGTSSDPSSGAQPLTSGTQPLTSSDTQGFPAPGAQTVGQPEVSPQDPQRPPELRKQQVQMLAKFIDTLQGSSAKNLKYLPNDSLSRFRQTVPTDIRSVDLDKMSESDLALTVHSVFDNANVLCGRKLRMGDLDDGGWEVCDDLDVRLTPPCTVYAFGVGYDWSFEDVLSRIYGCQIYSFDPTIGLKNHNRSSNIHFYNVGISSYNHVTQQGWQMMTFNEIKTMLGHTDLPIDLVKMDVEGSEWDAMHQMLGAGQFTGIKQVLMEFHVHSLTKSYLLPKLKDVSAFERLGYKKFHVNKNFNCPTWVRDFPIQRTLCYEVHFLYRP